MVKDMSIKEEFRLVPDQAERARRVSARLLWWIPLSPLVGFTAANWLLADSWPLWQVVPLAIILATPFGVGAYQGLRAVRLGSRRAWVTLAVHTVLMVVALVMPISEALRA